MKSYILGLINRVGEGLLSTGAISSMPSFDLSEPKIGLGDYACNLAFILAKEIKSNPNDLAKDLAEKIVAADKADKNILSEVQSAGGFINIFLKPEVLIEEINSFQKEVPLEQSGNGKKIVFEYSSPNTNKPLHIGHTRNDVYGKACINLLKACGYDVISCEVINDRGIHIMKSMLMYQKYGEGQTPESTSTKPDHFVGKYYVMFGQKNTELTVEGSDAPTALEIEAQDLLKKWENGDEETRKLWKQMNEWFFEGVKETYKKEGTTFDHVDYESDIYAKGKEIVQQGVADGVFTTEEDGSVSVDLTDKGLDKKYLLRKDGTTIYITQDIYLWSLRAKTFAADEQIVTTSAEQSYHFKVLKEIFTLMKYPWAPNFKHLPYEHVNLGKDKMSSRAGNAVSADDLLEEVKKRVLKTMADSQKIKASADDVELIEAIAFAAIKYGYLKYDSNTKIYFDIDETVAIEGNTGPYIQYANARIKSIIAKSGVDTSSSKSADLLKEQAEIVLAKFLLHYPEVVANAAKEFKPSLLCAYLYELAAKFNTMYDQVSVLNSDSEELKISRLNLLASASAVFVHGLDLLGIKAPNVL
jgi:arginyl-tRNA synthetase